MRSGVIKDGHVDLLTSHGHVLLVIASDNPLRLTEIAEAVGLTDRMTSKIVNRLDKAGLIEKIRNGRRNSYRISDNDFNLLGRKVKVDDLVRVFG